MVRKCEWKEHKGENPPKLTEKEKDWEKNFGWWLKDPEWLWLCPRCVKAWWDKRLKLNKVKK